VRSVRCSSVIAGVAVGVNIVSLADALGDANLEGISAPNPI